MTTPAEAQFPPRPGGMVDMARRLKAEVTQPEHAEDAPQASQGGPYPAVRTRVEEPDTFGAKTVVVTSGTVTGVVQLLGADPGRKRAIIMTLDEPVVVAVSRAQADDSRNAGNAAGQSAGGFVLPVNVPLPIYGTAEVYVAATSATASRVSAWAETFGGN